MATVNRGKTFTSGETVEVADMHQLVDAATVTFSTTDDTDNASIEVSGNKFRVKDAGVTDAKLATGIDASKITAGEMSGARLADDSVTNAKLSLSANDGEIKKAINADSAPPIFAARAWVLFDGDTFANAGGTYSRSGTVGTITTTSPHGQIVGHRVYINVASGGLASGEYVVQTVVDVNSFTVTIASGSGGGTMSLRRRSITAQGNVNDVAAMDTGLYHVNTSVAMPSSNYAAVTTCNESGVARQLGTSQGAATFRIEVRNGSGTITNASRISAVVFA
jgi:hypothetical protein